MVDLLVASMLSALRSLHEKSIVNSAVRGIPHIRDWKGDWHWPILDPVDTDTQVSICLMGELPRLICAQEEAVLLSCHFLVKTSKSVGSNAMRAGKSQATANRRISTTWMGQVGKVSCTNS